jgi:hypothetical protein
MKQGLALIAALFFVHAVFAQERAAVPSNNVVPPAIIEPASSTPSRENFPIIEWFGGASASLVDLSVGQGGYLYSLGHHGAYGWETSVSSTIYRWFAIEGGVSGYYGQVSVPYCDGCVPPVSIPIHYRTYAFLFGPRFNLPKGLFFHALLGASRLSASAKVSGTSLSVSDSSTSFALSPGFGFEAKLSRTLALRSSIDYLMTNFENSTQNHFRASVGPVFRFGGAVERTAALPRSASRSGMRIPALGVVVATRQNNDGAEIVELMSGSTAELAGLRVGDVLNAVDETVIKTPMDLAVELSNKLSGTKIKIGHTTRGYWQSETVLILADVRP